MRKVPPNDQNISDGYHTFKDLYNHRNLLYLAFLYERPNSSGQSWRSRLHHDGSSYDGWFIVGTKLQTDKGAVQISYHLPDELWNTCNFLETLDRTPQWDGHTSDDVLERLQSFLARHSPDPTVVCLVYNPQNPADLVDALQDPIHHDVGRSRPAKIARSCNRQAPLIQLTEDPMQIYTDGKGALNL